MSLSVTILGQIRDEIGEDNDFTDTDLEGIYEDTDRGNSSILRTALIVWKRRQFNLQARSFDASTGGSLLSRSQRIRFLATQISRLESLVDETHTGSNMDAGYANENSGLWSSSFSAEFS